jgi:peptidoglycan hydrolase CwlO-like protein
MHAGSPPAIRATVFILAAAAIVLAFVAYHEKSELAGVRSQLNQANSDTTQARTDAENFRGQVTSLQAQVSAAGTRVSDLQAQLDKVQGQSTGFQSQLSKDKVAQDDLRSQLNTAKEQAADFQAQISHANDGTALIRKQLDDANAHAADLQAQLDKAKSAVANPQPAAAAVPALPVAATFEKGFWGSRYTMHLKNQGATPLAVNVTVDGGAAKSATVQPGATYEVSDLKSGSSVVVSSDGFEPANLTVK